MKKIIFLCALVALCFAITGCTKNNVEISVKNDDTVEDTQVTTEETNTQIRHRRMIEALELADDKDEHYVSAWFNSGKVYIKLRSVAPEVMAKYEERFKDYLDIVVLKDIKELSYAEKNKIRTIVLEALIESDLPANGRGVNEMTGKINLSFMPLDKKIEKQTKLFIAKLIGENEYLSEKGVTVDMFTFEEVERILH
jgi:hypothetical protein